MSHPRATATDPRRVLIAGWRDDCAGRRTNKRCRNTRLRSSGYSLLFPTYREGYGSLLGRGSQPVFLTTVRCERA